MLKMHCKILMLVIIRCHNNKKMIKEQIMKPRHFVHFTPRIVHVKFHMTVFLLNLKV